MAADGKNSVQDTFLGKEGKEMEEDRQYYSEIEKRAEKNAFDEEKDVTNRETPYSQGYFSELDRTGEQTPEKSESDLTRQENLFKDEDFEE